MSNNGNRHDYLRVPVDIGGFDVKREDGATKICGYVEVEGVGRVPVCKKISDEDAARFFRKAFEDAKDEAARFKRRGGLKAWIARYFGREK